MIVPISHAETKEHVMMELIHIPAHVLAVFQGKIANKVCKTAKSH